jgi:wyosine [tRNA(Phe)-imidazoG37] synthetase (radical SAM superfamily)
MSGKGHPLPESDEARHREIPEHLARDKGRGEDGKEGVQPDEPAVNPDGEPYRYDDLGRGPDTSEGA